jgi:predicted RecA/RadA family phage recombinase
MKNFVQSGDFLTFVAPSGGVTSGVPLMIEAAIVVPTGSAAEGASFTGALGGVFALPKAPGEAWAVGAKLYWDDAEGRFTTTSTSNTLAGIAAAPAASGAIVGNVRLDGVPR